MHCKPLIFLSMLASVLLLTACSEDFKTTKNLYTDWWPVHASGSSQSDLFSATWDGDLDKHGNIEVTFKHKTDPSLSYTQTINYKALSFSKSKEKFCYVDLNDQYTASKYLSFYIEDGNIFMEKLDQNGKYDDGKPIKFQDENVLKIGNVTYHKYSYYKEKHPSQFGSSSAADDNERIPISRYE